MTPIHQSRRQRGAEIAVLLSAALWLGALINRGVNPVDEGWHLMRSWEVYRGFVTYRDFFAPMAPLGFFIQAGLMKIFGVHLMVGRSWAALEGLLAVYIALRVGRRRLRFPFSLAPGLLAIPYGAALGGFPHYNLDAAFFFLLSFALLDAYVDHPRGRTAFAAGLVAALAAASKQNLASTGLLLLGVGIFIGRGRQWRSAPALKDLAAGLVGFGIPLLALVAYYAQAHALQEMYANLFGLVGMKRVVLTQLLPPAAVMLLAALTLVGAGGWLARRQPRLAPALGLIGLGAAVAATALLPLEISGPLIASTTALSLVLFVSPEPGARAPWLLIRAYALLCFVSSALTAIDLGHILIATSGAIFSAGLFLERVFTRKSAWKRAVQAEALAAFILLLGVGFWLDLAVPHLVYAQGPRWRDTAAVRVPGFEGMRVEPGRAQNLEQTIGWIRDHTRDDEKIFVYPWHLVIYVFSDRLSATYNTFLYFEIFDHAILTRVLSDLERSRPRVIVVEMDRDRIRHVALPAEAEAIEGYIRSHYAPTIRFGEYQVMERIESADVLPQGG